MKTLKKLWAALFPPKHVHDFSGERFYEGGMEFIRCSGPKCYTCDLSPEQQAYDKMKEDESREMMDSIKKTKNNVSKKEIYRLIITQRNE